MSSRSRSRSSDKSDGQDRASPRDLESSWTQDESQVDVDWNAARVQVQEFRPAQLPVPQVSQAIQGGMQSPHSRLARYTRGSTLNLPYGSMPQAYQVHPISQSYSQPFHSPQSQFQPSSEIPQYATLLRERNTSPRGHTISPQWSWQSNVTSSPSSQRSSPHHTSRWGSLSPSPTPLIVSRPQSVSRPEAHQMAHAPLPSISSLNLDSTRRGTLTYNTTHPPFLTHTSFSMGEEAEISPSLTQVASVEVEQSASHDTSPAPTTTPLPQNLRGDPFRSAKVKTELCRYHNTPKGCVFGDKCNYAHGEHELKFNKLMDLERERLIDVEVFRTHPCFSWISTGACPFDQRCTRLHDPRLNGLQPSWLPHAEVLITYSGRGLNVDKMHHQQFCDVYSCSPVYGFAPKKRWQSDKSSTREAWQEFYSHCCSMDSSELGQENKSWPVHTKYTTETSITRTIIPKISEMHRLEMALIMRQRRKAQYFTFLPSHLFCGELCMVLQTSYFRLQVVESFQNINRYQITEIEEEDAGKESVENPFIITAREITFGPVADASVRSVAVWFNIPEEDITTCTRQQARRHKRSRHRLRQKRDYKNQPEEAKIAASCSIPPFRCCQPVDDAAFNLVTNIMSHRLRVLKYFSSRPDDQVRLSLVSEEEVLLKSFESQRRFWVTWTWPKRTGSNYIDDNTDVPDIDGAYSFVTYGNRAYGEDSIFFGAEQRSRTKGQDQVISNDAKLTTGFIWKSFIMNLQLVSDRGAVEVPTQEEQMPDHDPIVSQLPRIRTLRNLSLGRPAVRNSSRTPPSLNLEYCSFTGVSVSLDGLIREWTSLHHEHEENSSNPLKDAQMDKDKPPDPDHRRSVSYQYDEAAKSRTRLLPEYSD